jgi:pSer/pThr/pTyr-binding forkhead associated (FHA) protein
MLGQLVPCAGGPPIRLLKPRLLVGRHSYCDIPLRFSTVSGRHCELEFLDRYWFVRDLGSSNGTRVNGIICSAQRLLPNDVLSVARLRFSVSYAVPIDRTPVRGSAMPTLRRGGAMAAGDTLVPRATKPDVQPSPDHVEAAPLGLLLPCGGGDPIPLYKSPLVAGRHPECDIVLPLATISGKHCRLEWADGRWVVRDLGSSNGVRVNGVRCEVRALAPNSVLAIAHCRFQIVYTSPDREPMDSNRQTSQGSCMPEEKD